MLNNEIQQKILSSLHNSVLSTSMVARKTKLSRITVSKYLNTLAGKNVVQAIRVGKAVAWRTTEHKPVIAIIAKTGVARIVKLSLGEKYTYVLATSVHASNDPFVIITDNKLLARTTDIPVIYIGGFDEHSHSLPELFDPATLKALVKKILQEQLSPDTDATASITIEHFHEFEEALGLDKADDLLKLTSRVLRENRIPYKQFERTTFIIEGEIAEGVLLDVEQTFHLILSHVYGKMVTPGDSVLYDGVVHTAPSLTIAVGAYDELDAVNN